MPSDPTVSAKHGQEVAMEVRAIPTGSCCWAEKTGQDVMVVLVRACLTERMGLQ